MFTGRQERWRCIFVYSGTPRLVWFPIGYHGRDPPQPIVCQFVRCPPSAHRGRVWCIVNGSSGKFQCLALLPASNPSPPASSKAWTVGISSPLMNWVPLLRTWWKLMISSISPSVMLPAQLTPKVLRKLNTRWRIWSWKVLFTAAEPVSGLNSDLKFFPLD